MDVSLMAENLFSNRASFAATPSTPGPALVPGGFEQELRSFGGNHGGHRFVTARAHRCHTWFVLEDMKKLAFVVLVLAAVTGGFYFYRVRTAAPEPVVTSQPFSRGDIVEAVS